jgi:hypothetical protein
MKRKMKKFNEGGETKYDKEDKGLFGGKVNYREDSEGRKYVAGTPNAMERFPQEKRYYSVDDVKGKLSGLFGGKKEAPKSVDSEPVGDANKSSSYNTRAKSEEAPTRKIEDYIKKSEPEEPYKPTGKTVLNKEADIDYKSEKKAKKAASDDRKSLGDKATRLPGNAADKDKKVTKLPGRGDDKKPLGKGATPMKAEDDKPAKYEDDKVNIGSQGSFKFDSKPVARTRAGTVVKSSDEPNALDVAAAKQKSAERLKKQYKENDATFKRIGDAFSSKSPNRSYKSGGSVRSASARADGCAIRGKTRA